MRHSPAMWHGVLQGTKLRPVDDFTRSGANLSNSTFTKPYLCARPGCTGDCSTDVLVVTLVSFS
eukprot:1216582-Amphidinium_carterae.1